MPKKSVMELYLAGAGGNVQPRAKQELRHVTDTYSQPVENPPPVFPHEDEDSIASAVASAYEEAHEERTREKMAMIDEMEKGGGQRAFGPEDSMRSVELEFNRQRVAAEAKSGVVFMKQMLKMGLQGIEMGNNRFGPWLQLDGFAEEASKDDEKYDAPLERIYMRIFRHGQISPYIELAMLIGGSAFMCHLKNTMAKKAELAAEKAQQEEAPASREPKAEDRPRKRMRRMSFKPQLDTVDEETEGA